MFKNAVQETTTTTGTGTISLSAVTGFARFSDAFNHGDQVSYAISHGDSWEWGIGTVRQLTNELERTTVLAIWDGSTYNDINPTALSLSDEADVFCEINDQTFDERAGTIADERFRALTGRTRYAFGDAVQLGNIEPESSAFMGSSVFDFKPDGTRLFMNDGEEIYQYDLNEPWDITTLQGQGPFFEVQNTMRGARFSQDGTLLFQVYEPFSGQWIKRYSLSTPWDVTTMSDDGLSFEVNPNDGGPPLMSPDGKRFYLINGGLNRIRQHDMTTPWDPSTASQGSTFTFPESIGDMLGFDEEGKRLFLASSTSSEGTIIYTCTLSTPWDIATAQQDGPGIQLTTLAGGPMLVRTGERFYLFRGDDDNIYQFDITRTPDAVGDTPQYEADSNDDPVIPFPAPQAQKEQLGVAETQIGQMIWSAAGSVSWPNFLRMDGQTVAKTDYPDLATWADNNGVLELTLIAGDSWSILAPLGSTGDALGLGVGDDGTLLVVRGDDVFRSMDSGDSWTNTATVGETVYDLATDGAGTWVLGAGPSSFAEDGAFIYRSTNNGGSFSNVLDDVGSGQTGVDTDRDGVWVTVGGAGSAFRSTDNGETWSAVSLGSSANFEAVATDRNGVWVACAHGSTAVRSDDNGQTWSSVSVPASERLEGIATDRNGTWVIVGENGGIYQSADNGASWSTADVSGVNALRAVATDGEGLWMAVGPNGELVRSDDNGATWTHPATPTSNGIGRVAPVGGGRWLLTTHEDADTVMESLPSVDPDNLRLHELLMQSNGASYYAYIKAEA